jgi:hypothetical protein
VDGADHDRVCGVDGADGEEVTDADGEVERDGPRLEAGRGVRDEAQVVVVEEQQAR